MTRLFFALLTLLFLSGPAMGGNSDFRRCSLAAKGPLLSQVRQLRDFGVDQAGRRSFFNGEVVSSGFTTARGASVDGFLQLKNNTLTSQLFSLANNGNQGAGTRALLQFQR